MINDLRAALNHYLEGGMDRRALEEWLGSHMHAILNSGDSRAIEAVKRVEALSARLGDGVITEREFFDQVARLAQALEPIVIVLAAGNATSSSGSRTFCSDGSTGPARLVAAGS